MKKKMKPERLEIRKRIQEAGEKLYESIEDEDLKWLVGEIMCLNECWVMENPDTYGAELILSQGFTDNQKKWITNLNKKLKKMKKIREWFLKEIDKEFLKICKGKDIDTVAFFAGLEAGIIEKIKKAFSGVIEE